MKCKTCGLYVCTCSSSNLDFNTRFKSLDLTPKIEPMDFTPKFKPLDLTPKIEPMDFTPKFKPLNLTPKIEPMDFTPKFKPMDLTPKIEPIDLTPKYQRYDKPFDAPGSGGPRDAAFHQQQFDIGHIKLPYFKFGK